MRCVLFYATNKSDAGNAARYIIDLPMGFYPDTLLSLPSHHNFFEDLFSVDETEVSRSPNELQRLDFKI